jgi:hypothetical protein
MCIEGGCDAVWRKMGTDMQIQFGGAGKCRLVFILTNGLKGCISLSLARAAEGVAPAIHQDSAAAAVERSLDTLNELFSNDNGLPRGHHQSPLTMPK